MAKQRYNVHQDRHTQLDQMDKKDNEAHVNRPSLFRNVAKKSATERYNRLLPKKLGPYNVLGVNENTLHILQDGLDNTVSIHRATLPPPSGRHCERPNREEEASAENESSFKKDPGKPIKVSTTLVS